MNHLLSSAGLHVFIVLGFLEIYFSIFRHSMIKNGIADEILILVMKPLLENFTLISVFMVDGPFILLL